MELCDLTALELTSLLRLKKASAVEILESSLRRIGEVDGRPGSLEDRELTDEDRAKVHAFITVSDERALAKALEIDGMIARGEDPGPLAGVPFSVKDIFCVKGTTTTAASRILSNFTAPYTATPVARMEKAGAVMIGKVNLDEFTFGSSSESSAYRPTPRNPWKTERVPGGSSGGSAASVAAGEAPLSLGTDTAGSIRQPAGFCGVVGLKPTYGRVSRYGLIAFASSLDCPGPLAHDVRDAAAMLQVIAGHDEHDSTSAAVPVPDYTAALQKGVKGLRIGLIAGLLPPDISRFIHRRDQVPTVPRGYRAGGQKCSGETGRHGRRDHRRCTHAEHQVRHSGLFCHQPRGGFLQPSPL